MEKLGIRATLTLEDWRALLVAAGVRRAEARRANESLTRYFAPTLLWLALGAVAVFMMTRHPPLIRPAGVAVVLASFFAFIYAMARLQRGGYAPASDGSFLGTTEFEFGSEGFHVRRPTSVGFIRWSLVKEISSTDDHVFMWIDTGTAYVIPARDLSAPMTPPTAVAKLRELKAAAPQVVEAAPDPISPMSEPAAMITPVAVTASAQAEAPSATLPSVAQELSALLRLYFWPRVDGAHLQGRDITLILLGVLSFVLWAGIDWLGYKEKVELSWYQYSDVGVLVVSVLLLAWLMSRVSRPQIEVRRSLLVLLGFMPVFVLGCWFMFTFDQVWTIALFVFLFAGWADRYLVSGMRSITGRPQHLATGSVLAATLLLFYLSTQVFFSPGIWYAPEDETEESVDTGRADEQLVFGQALRIAADIEKFPAPEAGKTNTWFVGFAGFGDQRVFAEEIQLAAKQIGARYGTTARSMLLVNDRRNFEKYPLASAPALRQTLVALGKRMNDDDVLFLSLSSHGSEDATLSVSSELAMWRDLEADDLADMLRESGIRYRVIVISACYAGSFIDALRDENTIVLTAAAADRTSFGCADDTDLTYFGEAFYRDALPKAATLREAFDGARAEVERREGLEVKTGSNPQAYFGAAMEQKLAQLEAARSK